MCLLSAGKGGTAIAYDAKNTGNGDEEMSAHNVEHHGVAHVVPASNIYRCLCGQQYPEASELADHLVKKTRRFIGELDIAKGCKNRHRPPPTSILPRLPRWSSL